MPGTRLLVPARRPHRPRPGGRTVDALGAILGVAVALGSLREAYLIVCVERNGPVIAEVSATHGVHSGDLLAIPLVLLAAGALCWAVASAAWVLLPRR